MKTQKTILICALLVLTMVSLFPPWSYTHYRTGTNDFAGFRSEKDAGHHFVFLPPQPEKEALGFGVKLDIARLGLECLCVAAVTGAALLVGNLLAAKKPNHN